MTRSTFWTAGAPYRPFPVFVLPGRLTPSLILVLGLLVTGSATAQDYPQIDALGGAGHSYAIGDVDTVNRFSGNLVVRIPLQSYSVGSHLSYDFSLVYNSSGVHKGISQFTDAFRPKPHPDSNAGAGWRWSLGDLREEVVQSTSRFYFIDSGGAEHRFHDSLHPWVNDGSASTDYTRDGSYVRMRVINGTRRDVDHPDGRIFEFTKVSTSPPKWRLTKIRDRFGHEVTISYDSYVTTVSDTLGRTHEVHWSPGGGGLLPDYVNRFDLAGPNGTRANWILSHAWKDTYACTPGEGSPMPYNMPLLYNVSQPGGLENPWQMGGAGSPAYGSCGDLTELRLPTRGLLRWTWQSWGFPQFAIFPEEPIRWAHGVRERRLLTPSGDLIGVWKYFQSPDVANKRTRTVVQPPSGACEVHHFRAPNQTAAWDYGLPFDPNVANTTAGLTLYLSQEIYSASGASNCTGSKLRSVYVHYEREGGVSDSNQRLYGRRVHYHDDGNRWVQTRFTGFDGLGHFRQVVTSGSIQSGDSRTERTQYNRNGNQTLIVDVNGNPEPGYTHPPVGMPWVLGVYAYQQQQEGGVTARQNFAFDGTTGFLNSRRILRSETSTSSLDVLVTYTRYPDTNVAGRGQVKDEKWSLGSSAPDLWLLHSYEKGVLSKTEYRTAGGASTGLFQHRATIDQSSGLPTQTTDTSNVVTNYSYDLLGRVTKAQAGAGGGACLTYSYTKAAGSTGPKWGVTRGNASCSGNLGQRESWYDPWGRKTHDRVLLPNSTWTQRRYQYNARGWLTQEAAWGNSNWTKFEDFDAFGRPETIRPPAPEDPAHYVKLTYTGDRIVRRGVSLNLDDTSPSETRVAVSYEHRDSFGRLVSVETPAKPGGSLVATNYQYDVGNRLSHVNMGGQVRTFAYDNRGFLTQECHPEKGVQGNGCVNYSAYDALGNAKAKQEGSRTLSSQYDFAGRLTKVWSNWDATVSEWDYDGAAGYGKGKVHIATRKQNVDFPGDGVGPLQVNVEEQWKYQGPAGAPSERLLRIIVPSVPVTYAFRTELGHNDAGQPTRIDYPVCTQAACGGDGPARTVNAGWTRGFQTSVGGYASSITYHPQGLWSTVVHTNGVTDNQSIWQGQGRPGRIWTTGSTGGTFDTGAFQYDGVGNVKRMGNDDFGYQHSGRLKYAEVSCQDSSAASCHRQSYEYDTLGRGNLFKVSTHPRGGTETAVTWMIDPGTNRLKLPAQYDVAGNMTESSYQDELAYDSQDALVRMGPGGDNASRVFAYTADGERVWTILGGGSQVLYVRGLNNELLRTYRRGGPAGSNWNKQWDWTDDTIWRGSQRLASVGTTGYANRTHYHVDHLGTPRLHTNGSGQMTERLDVYPFGRDTPETTSASVRFTGHERDNMGSGDGTDDMDYMHARFYSPQMGRFFQVDPVGGAPANPQSWNRYAYVQNNPLKYSDPTGERIATGFAVLKALQDILRDVGEEDLADRLQLVSVRQQHNFLGFKWTTTKTFVGSGDADLSQSSNPVAALIGDAIKTDVTVDVRFTSQDLSGKGGAKTVAKGFDPARSDHQNKISIRINSKQVAQNKVVGASGFIDVPLGAALVHEIGHSHGHFQGRADPSLGNTGQLFPTDDWAVGKENIYRDYVGLPRRSWH